MEFFLITTMMALDFLGSATVMVFTARRTVAYTWEVRQAGGTIIAKDRSRCAP